MTSSNKNIGLQYGLILGVFVLILRCYIYFFNTPLIVAIWLGTVTIIFFMLFGVAAVWNFKKKRLGFISFKDAFSNYFLTIVIGHFSSFLSTSIITNLFLPSDVLDAIKTLSTDFSLSVLKQNHATTKQIQQAIVYFKSYNPFSFSEITSGTVKYLLRDCLIGLFVCLIFRNKTAS